MFEQTLSQGNWLVPILLSYVAVVATQHTKLASLGKGLFLPPILETGLANFITLTMTPTIFIPALYVGIYDGFFAGIVIFILLPGLMVLFTRMLNVTRFIAYHYLIASLIMPLGYYLTLITWP
jgi:hypothetical protein